MNNNKNKETLVAIPESALLALVASKLKNAVLFPEKLENAKAYLKKATLKKA